MAAILSYQMRSLSSKQVQNLLVNQPNHYSMTPFPCGFHSFNSTSSFSEYSTASFQKRGQTASKYLSKLAEKLICPNTWPQVRNKAARLIGLPCLYKVTLRNAPKRKPQDMLAFLTLSNQKACQLRYSAMTLFLKNWSYYRAFWAESRCDLDFSILRRRSSILSGNLLRNQGSNSINLFFSCWSICALTVQTLAWRYYSIFSFWVQLNSFFGLYPQSPMMLSTTSFILLEATLIKLLTMPADLDYTSKVSASRACAVWRTYSSAFFCWLISVMRYKIYFWWIIQLSSRQLTIWLIRILLQTIKIITMSQPIDKAEGK